jgi:hypothetical protein
MDSSRETPLTSKRQPLGIGGSAPGLNRTSQESSRAGGAGHSPEWPTIRSDWAGLPERRLRSLPGLGGSGSRRQIQLNCRVEIPEIVCVFRTNWLLDAAGEFGTINWVAFDVDHCYTRCP